MVKANQENSDAGKNGDQMKRTATLLQKAPKDCRRDYDNSLLRRMLPHKLDPDSME